MNRPDALLVAPQLTDAIVLKNRLKVCALLFALGSLCLARDLSAFTVAVTAAGMKQAPSVVTAKMRRVDGEQMPAADLQLAVGTPTEVDLSDGTWEITVTSPGLWAAPVYATGSQAVTLQVWPRGVITGTLGGKSPASGDLVVNFVPTQSTENEVRPAGTTMCGFLNREWSCLLPTGEHDLRFSLTGFATEFRWGVKVGEETAVALGQLDFTPGSSVFGKVQLRNVAMSEILRSAEVSLTPANTDPSLGNVRQYTTRPDGGGFFQIRGLAPGEYSLRAWTKDLISETRTVQVIAQTNASLKEPLLLAKPSRISITITPPLDENRRPWQVELLRMQHGANHMDVMDRSLASAKGAWSQHRVLPGDYLLTIGQQDGSEWRTEELTVRSEDGDLPIEIILKSERVAGRVTLGDRPVAARVRFGGEHGPGLVADEDGRFEGTIPTPPKEGEITLLVTSETPDIQRTLVLKGDRSPDGALYFDIQLPATTIIGRTINEDGSSEPSAVVTLRSKDDRVFEQMFSNEDGSFQFAGFDPGLYALQADAFQKLSAVVYVEARSDGSSSTDLVLRAHEQVRGQVSMRGAPVAGAVIHALPRNVKTSFGLTETSDAAGRFVLKLPPGTITYDVIAFPRGFYVTAARITRDPKQYLGVEVGQDGGTLHIDAPEDEVLLLLVHAGGEFSLPWVARESGGVVSGENGRRRLTIPNLESGNYSVCRKQKCTSVYVPRFATASVTVAD